MRIVPATADLVPALLDRLGPERTAVIAERAGGDPVAAIRANIARSGLSWAGLDGEGVVVMGGVMPQRPASGYVWQFLSAAVRQHKRGYIELSRRMMDEGMREYRRLVTVIEADYRAALRHCERNGWTVGEPRDLGGVLACVCERVR